VRLLQFLARAPQACLVLMLAGAVTLVWAGSGSATLKSEFCWALGVLIGIVAITRNTIRGDAASPGRVPLRQSASALRRVLLYTGSAWGLGAFLVMPNGPAPLLGFCVLPALALALLLKDAKAIAAFGAPVTLACAGAALWRAWPSVPGVAVLLLVAGVLTCCLAMLQGMNHTTGRIAMRYRT
jgi:hypothetical protein